MIPETVSTRERAMLYDTVAASKDVAGAQRDQGGYAGDTPGKQSSAGVSLASTRT